MIVQTDIPCGNGRIKWLRPGVFEIEVIAYSKAPRYAYFRIVNIEKDVRQEIVLRPDSHMPLVDFKDFHGHVWLRTKSQPEWKPLPKNKVEIAPNAVRFSLDLKRGGEYDISTEPAREYAKTNDELFALAERLHGFARLHCLGHSIEQRPIFLLRVTANPETLGAESKPVLTFMAGEHASEFAGEEIVRGMLDLVTAESADARKFRNAYIFDFILNSNPDGNHHGWHQYNVKDWLEHNYSDGKDRSWHHEFGPFFEGKSGDYSPETIAIGNYIKKCEPVFYLTAHSWQGHRGNPGAFHASLDILPETTATRQGRLIQIAKQIAQEHFGVEFETFPSSNLTAGHLDSFLLRSGKALALAIEGHMNLGRKNLQKFGAFLLDQWLNNVSFEKQGTEPYAAISGQNPCLSFE